MVETSTLLIVDDCEVDREVFREYLSEDPHTEYEIYEAEEAAEGLAICKEIQCDLILLDFRLPDMTGLEFLKQQQQSNTFAPSVIMTTGEGCEAIAVQALKQGADNYLSKQDLAPEELIEAVRHAIQQRRFKSFQNTPILPAAMAAAVLRFRRSLELQPLVEAAVNEIRHLTQCDRASIFQSNRAIRDADTALAEAQSLALVQQLRHYATAQRRRHRGRPPKHRVAPVELSSIRYPIHLPEQDERWGYLQLEYLADSPPPESEDNAAFEALIDALAIAISHAQLYEQALRTHQEQQTQLQEIQQRLKQSALQGRQLLGHVALAASTLVQMQNKLKPAKQTQILRQIEDKSRAFVQLLEGLSHP